MVRFLSMLLAFSLAPIAYGNLLFENPVRSHGYFIGDVLLQRVNLDSLSETVSAQNLETDQRIDDYLYRLPTKEVIVEKQTWLELRYQIINSPMQTETIALPAVTFITDAGDEQNLPAWQFTVAPLTASGGGGDDAVDSSPLPDRRALDLIETRDSKTLKQCIAALLTTLALWLLWWVVRHFRDSHTLPFAKANRIIKKIPSAERSKDPQAWIALHHAFNDVAGKAISNSTLAQLFIAAPWLVQYKDKVENFYAASSARFYQQAESQPIAVAELCSNLHRAEKRQAKQAKKVFDGAVG